jgi:uncharacterized membrane protein YphA (DoxX/SURF4 family)
VRAALGGLAITFGALYLSNRTEHAVVVWAVASILIVSGIALVVGFLTPLASLGIGLCVLGMAFSWFPGPPPFATLATRLLVLLVIVTAAGIGLLGPGCFSVDGRLFGRREIVIPPRPPE